MDLRRLARRAWNRLCCVGYGVQARADAVAHVLRGHDLTWNDGCRDLWTGHLGCIVCRACADSSDGKTDVLFWSRRSGALHWLARLLCARLGHPEARHPQTGAGEDADGNPLWVDVEDEWYCFRCGAQLQGPVLLPERDRV